MNGKVLAIGVFLFTILACIAVYFVFQATLNKAETGIEIEQTATIIESVHDNFIQ